MEEIFKELDKAKKQDEEEIKNIKYVFNKNKNIKKAPQFKKQVYEIRSKDEMYEEMKKKFRLQWKGTKRKHLFFYYAILRYWVFQ
jgi:uncharacterized protein YjlB